MIVSFSQLSIQKHEPTYTGKKEKTPMISLSSHFLTVAHIYTIHIHIYIYVYLYTQRLEYRFDLLEERIIKLEEYRQNQEKSSWSSKIGILGGVKGGGGGEPQPPTSSKIPLIDDVIIPKETNNSNQKSGGSGSTKGSVEKSCNGKSPLSPAPPAPTSAPPPPPQKKPSDKPKET